MMQNIPSLLAGAQPSREQQARFAIERNESRRIVPAGDDLRGQGQRVAAATAGFAVDSAALTAGRRYYWRVIDAGGGTSYMRTKLAGGAEVATNASRPLLTGDEGYLFVPADGSWDTVSFLAPNLTAVLYLIESREKEEDLL